MLKNTLLRHRLLEGDPDPTGKPPSTPPQSGTFSAEYVKELRHENAGYRVKAQEQEKLRQEAEQKLSLAEQQANERISAAERAANDRIVRAELKAEAIKAGIVDIDGLQLADLSAIKFDEKGNLVGASEAIEKLRKDKPYLFTKSTSSTHTPPGNDPPRHKKATEMTDAEYAAECRRLGLPAPRRH